MLRTLTLASAIALAASTGAWAQKDAALGTWNLNVAKSSIKSGPPPKGAVVSFEPSGKGVKSVQELVDADGKKNTVTYTAAYDGKDYPITGSASAETVALKSAGANTVERLDKKGGKVVATWSRSVSRDGRTMTATHKGTGADGKPFTNTWVFDRAGK